MAADRKKSGKWGYGLPLVIALMVSVLLHFLRGGGGPAPDGDTAAYNSGYVVGFWLARFGTLPLLTALVIFLRNLFVRRQPEADAADTFS